MVDNAGVLMRQAVQEEEEAIDAAPGKLAMNGESESSAKLGKCI